MTSTSLDCFINRYEEALANGDVPETATLASFSEHQLKLELEAKADGSYWDNDQMLSDSWRLRAEGEAA